MVCHVQTRPRLACRPQKKECTVNQCGMPYRFPMAPTGNENEPIVFRIAPDHKLARKSWPTGPCTHAMHPHVQPACVLFIAHEVTPRCSHSWTTPMSFAGEYSSSDPRCRDNGLDRYHCRLCCFSLKRHLSSVHHMQALKHNVLSPPAAGCEERGRESEQDSSATRTRCQSHVHAALRP